MSLFFSHSISSVPGWSDSPVTPPSLSFFLLIYFNHNFSSSLSFSATNFTISVSISFLSLSLSFFQSFWLWLLRWLLPQTAPAFPLPVSLPSLSQPLPFSMAGYYGWKLVRGKSLSVLFIVMYTVKCVFFNVFIILDGFLLLLWTACFQHRAVIRLIISASMK